MKGKIKFKWLTDIEEENFETIKIFLKASLRPILRETGIFHLIKKYNGRQKVKIYLPFVESSEEKEFINNLYQICEIRGAVTDVVYENYWKVERALELSYNFIDYKILVKCDYFFSKSGFTIHIIKCRIKKENKTFAKGFFKLLHETPVEKIITDVWKWFTKEFFGTPVSMKVLNSKYKIYYEILDKNLFEEFLRAFSLFL